MINNVGSVTGSPTSVLSAGPGGKLGKDEFMRMLVAQLRNQDPLNPMKGEEFAAQLAQFSSLEQLMNLGAQMEVQMSYQDSIAQALHSNTALGAIGRDVLAVGDQVVVPGSGPASVTVMVGNQGGTGRLVLRDESGREVGSRDLGSVSAGKQTFELGSAADGLAPGKYTYSVEVVDGSGGSVPIQTFISGRVDGIRYGSEGPVLTMGPLTIPLSAVVEVVAAK